MPLHAKLEYFFFLFSGRKNAIKDNKLTLTRHDFSYSCISNILTFCRCYDIWKCLIKPSWTLIKICWIRMQIYSALRTRGVLSFHDNVRFGYVLEFSPMIWILEYSQCMWSSKIKKNIRVFFFFFCSVVMSHLDQNTKLLSPICIWAGRQHFLQDQVHPTKTQITMRMRTVCSDTSLCVPWLVKDQRHICAASEDSDQTERMCIPIFVFALRTCNTVGFPLSRSIWQFHCCSTL